MLAKWLSSILAIAFPTSIYAATLGDLKDFSDAWIVNHGRSVLTDSHRGHLALWDVSTGKRLPSDLDRIAGGQQSWKYVDQEGRWIIAGSNHHGTKLYDMDTGGAISVTLPAYFLGRTAKACLSPDRSLVMTFEQVDVARVYEVKTGRKVAILPLSQNDASIEEGPEGCFENDGKRVWILESGGTIRCYNTMTWQPEGAALQHPGEGVFSGLSISPDSRFIIAASSIPDCGGEGVVRVWDTVTRQPVGNAIERERGACGQFIDNGKRILFSFGRGQPYVASLGSLDAEYYLPLHSDIDGPRVSFANGDRTFVTSGYNTSITFTDSISGEFRGSYEFGDSILDHTSSPVADQAIVILGRPSGADPSKPRPLYVAKVDRKPDAGKGESLRLAAYSAVPQSTDGYSVTVRMAPDGKTFMLLSNNRIRLFNSEDLKELPATLTPSTP
jgi:WD40 repeat protein